MRFLRGFSAATVLVLSTVGLVSAFGEAASVSADASLLSPTTPRGAGRLVCSARRYHGSSP